MDAWVPLTLDFPITDTTSFIFLAKKLPSVRQDLIKANARITLVEAHALQGDTHIVDLTNQLAICQENLYHASAKIKEHDADILEVNESLRQRNETIANDQVMEQPTILPI